MVEVWGVSARTAVIVGIALGFILTLSMIVLGASPSVAGIVGFLLGCLVVLEGWAAVKLVRFCVKLLE